MFAQMVGRHLSAVLHHRFGIPTYKTQKGCMRKGCWPHSRVRSLSWGGPGSHCRYSEDRVPPPPPRASFRLRQRLRLPPPGWGQFRDFHASPRLWLPSPGSVQLRGRHVSPQLEAAPGPPRVTWAPAPTFWLRAASEMPCVPMKDSAGCKQLNKYSLATRPS
jgi:hypothetical protein